MAAVRSPRCRRDTGPQHVRCPGAARADTAQRVELLAVAPHAFDDLDLGTGAMFASFVSLAAVGTSARREADQLRAGLESSRQIGVAMGILMARNLLTQDQAFERLRASSQHLNVKLRDIAAGVAETASYPISEGASPPAAVGGRCATSRGSLRSLMLSSP